MRLHQEDCICGSLCILIFCDEYLLLSRQVLCRLLHFQHASRSEYSLLELEPVEPCMSGRGCCCPVCVLYAPVLLPLLRMCPVFVFVVVVYLAACFVFMRSASGIRDGRRSAVVLLRQWQSPMARVPVRLVSCPSLCTIVPCHCVPCSRGVFVGAVVVRARRIDGSCTLHAPNC